MPPLFEVALLVKFEAALLLKFEAALLVKFEAALLVKPSVRPAQPWSLRWPVPSLSQAEIAGRQLSVAA